MLNKTILLLMILLLCCNSHAETKSQNKCDIVFAKQYREFMEKESRQRLDIAIDYRITFIEIAEDRMLTLAMFDSQGCSNKIKSLIKKVYDSTNESHKSYQRLVALSEKLNNTSWPEKKAVSEDFHRERKDNFKIVDKHIKQLLEMDTYVITLQ